MKEQAPFTDDEQSIWSSLANIAGKFNKLPATHPSDLKEVEIAIHHLQDVLARRIMRRAYPGSFATYRKGIAGWVLEEKEPKDA